MFVRILSTVLTLVSISQIAIASEPRRFYHENVLGTSLELVFAVSGDVDDVAVARRGESLCLEEIARLDKILSRYKDDSELMRWQRGEIETVSADLYNVLVEAERYRAQTNGYFHVQAIVFSDLWKTCRDENRMPSDLERLQLVKQLCETQFTFNESNRTVSMNSKLPLSLDGIAKGYVLDRVCSVVRESIPEISGMMVNIGGDLRKVGDLSVPVRIVDPFGSAENEEPLVRWTLDSDLAMTTSGGYRRYLDWSGRRWSHLVDPVVGLPVESIASVTVMAKTGLDADAISTALSAMPLEMGLAWAEGLSDVSCLIVDSHGNIHTAGDWPTKVLQDLRQTPVQRLVSLADSQEKKYGLHVDFELSRPGKERYRRPYVAIWLEDAEGFPVKTAILWLQTESPGPSWHRDLTRWYRNDRLRKVHEKTDLIETISGATRGPGQYDAHFDGTDNAGEQLPDGTYTLCIEVTRENGTYKIIREKVEWGATAIDATELPSNTEVSKASYSFHPKLAD